MRASVQDADVVATEIEDDDLGVLDRDELALAGGDFIGGGNNVSGHYANWRLAAAPISQRHCGFVRRLSFVCSGRPGDADPPELVDVPPRVVDRTAGGHPTGAA